MSSTAGDMANFMIAHLNKGELKGEAILSPEATGRMHRRQFAAMPEAGGLTMGFIEIFRNDKRLILHGGDTYLFHSGMFFIPDEKVGIFVSYNAPRGGQARMNLLNSFLDRYFPASKGTSAAVTVVEPRAAVTPVPLANLPEITDCPAPILLPLKKRGICFLQSK